MSSVTAIQSELIRDFEVPKFAIKGQNAFLSCGYRLKKGSSLEALLWYKVQSIYKLCQYFSETCTGFLGLQIISDRIISAYRMRC